MVDLSVKIGSVELKNPIMPASGAFSTDLAQVMDINRLGALVAKTVSPLTATPKEPDRKAPPRGRNRTRTCDLTRVKRAL